MKTDDYGVNAPPSLLPINEAAITLLNVDVAYEEKKILNNVNLHIRPRDFVVISGPKSSGKSSLLRIIAGVQHPTRGAVIVGAHNLEDLDVAGFRRQALWIPTGSNEVELLDKATQSTAPVLVIDEPRAEDERVFVFGILRLIGQRTIICATNSPDLISQAGVVIDLNPLSYD